ncbi:MAG: hypothetical protein AAF823_11025 [Planctomycetota bacterium]
MTVDEISKLKIVIDTNLLLLLIVYSACPELVGKARRVQDFTVEDSESLVRIISASRGTATTTHVLTETSNLLGQVSGLDRERLMTKFKGLIYESDELCSPARRVAKNPAFVRLGITDAALVDTLDESTVLLSVDAKLVFETLNQGKLAINFNHYRFT